MTLLENKQSEIRNRLQHDENYADTQKINIQNRLTLQFMTVNKILIEATKNLVPRKDVIQHKSSPFDPITKVKEYCTMRQIGKLIGIAKSLIKDYNTEIKDDFI